MTFTFPLSCRLESHSVHIVQPCGVRLDVDTKRLSPQSPSSACSCSVIRFESDQVKFKVRSFTLPANGKNLMSALNGTVLYEDHR
jgi:hypothetical protein